MSTTTLAPCAWAISAVLAMSITDIVGLAGVSMYTTFVLELDASSCSSRSPCSRGTLEFVMPYFGRTSLTRWFVVP